MTITNVIGIEARVVDLGIATLDDEGTTAVCRPVVPELTPGQEEQTVAVHEHGTPVILRLVVREATSGEVSGAVRLKIEGASVAFKDDTWK